MRNVPDKLGELLGDSYRVSHENFVEYHITYFDGDQNYTVVDRYGDDMFVYPTEFVSREDCMKVVNYLIDSKINFKVVN